MNSTTERRAGTLGLLADPSREGRSVRRRPRRRRPPPNARPAARRGRLAREHRGDVVYASRAGAADQRFGRSARRHRPRAAAHLRRAPSSPSARWGRPRTPTASRKRSSAIWLRAYLTALEPVACLRTRPSLGRARLEPYRRCPFRLFEQSRTGTQPRLAALPRSDRSLPARRSGLHEAPRRGAVPGRRRKVSR